jgi:hypothetical protein
VRFFSMTKRDCPVCKGIGRICENHTNVPWDDEIGCTCGAGRPCECNSGDEPEPSSRRQKSDTSLADLCCRGDQLEEWPPFAEAIRLLVIPMMVTPNDYRSIPIMVVPTVMPSTIIATVIAVVAVAVVLTVTTEPEPEFLRARYRRRSDRNSRECGEYE